MGEIKLKFEIKNKTINPSNIAGEIEYGITFSLYENKETAIYPSYKTLKWINNCEYIDDELHISINEKYFCEDTFFDKLITTFIFNLLDFSHIKLNEIIFNSSLIFESFIQRNNLPIIDLPYPAFGTILKPYYLPLSEKKIMISTFFNNGIQFIKEDETFVENKNTILEHAMVLQNCIGNNGSYIPNITAYVNDYQFIENLIKKSNIKIAMVNFFITGLNNVVNLKKTFPQLLLWGHRVGNLVFEQYLSPQVISQLAVLAGIDFLHIGTPRFENEYIDKLELIEKLNNIRTIKAVFTKTTSNTLPKLVQTYKERAVYMACGNFRNKDGLSINNNKIQEWVNQGKLHE